jgi:hypothetical protein
MILAIVIAAQMATAPNPCANQLAELCKISPYFCAGAYPTNLVPGTNGIPCWPERSVAPLHPSSIGTRNTNSVDRTQSNHQAAPQPTMQSDAAAETVRERFARALQRLARTSSP